MNDNEYRQFIVCRQTKLFSRGIQPVLNWLGLERRLTKDGKHIETPLRDRKTLEMFGYILRTILQRIVLETVRIHNSELKPVETGSLTLEEY